MGNRVLAFLAVVVLAGCGADGEPVRPTLDSAVRIGSDGDVDVASRVRLSRGRVTLGVGF